MQHLEPIPVPPGQKWRQFRNKVLPAAVFLCTVLAIAAMWKGAVHSPTFIPDRVQILAEVRARAPGLLTNLFVQELQPIQKGEAVAAIMPLDTRAAKDRIQELQEEIAAAEIQLREGEKDRALLDVERIRVEYMLQKTDLEIAQAELPKAEYRAALLKQQAAEESHREAEYKTQCNRVESLRARVQEFTRHLAELERLLKGSGKGDDANTPVNRLMVHQALARLEQQQSALEQLSSQPILLKSPIDGFVSTILRRAGETLDAGEPVAVITSNSDTAGNGQAVSVATHLEADAPIIDAAGHPLM